MKSRVRGIRAADVPMFLQQNMSSFQMVPVPGDCAWYFYKRLMGHTDAAIPSEEIRKQYREYVKGQSKVEEKLERGIDMLLEVAELKYGRQYAQSLKKKMRGGTD